MPSVLVEIRRECTEEFESQLLEEVHMSLVDEFKIPMDDRNVRLFAHKPHRFHCPPEKTNPELYTHISIDCFSGRKRETKKALYKNIVYRLSKLGIPEDHVKVLLREIPKDNWGIMGGQMASDVDLGFSVEV